MMQEDKEKTLKNAPVELDRIFVESMRDMIRQKIDELKAKDFDEDIKKTINHIEKIAKSTIKLEEFEKSIKNDLFNGYLFNAEIFIINTMESVLKDVEKLQQEDRLRSNHIKLSIYEKLNDMAAIIEKYLD